MAIENANDLKQKMIEIRNAQRTFASYTQTQVEEIFRQAAMAANNARIELAKIAVTE